jgi:N-hydroxyarylamine O-acetyltransferase
VPPAPALLDAYLRRIGLSDRGGPDVGNLRRLHAAHVEAIPFENLDILLGRGITLDVEYLRAKLIERGRGGYCFEQNTLFLAILRELGYLASPMEARVRVGSPDLRPRTHMVLVVETGGAQWLADVGFGGEGPVEPVPMGGGSVLSAGLEYRVVEEGPQRVLQMLRGSAWIDQYAFLPQPVHPVDFEVANWYTSTHPQSPFVRTLTAQRSTPAVRYVLRYPVYTEIRGADITTREITRGELLPLLREIFLIDLPDATTFPAIDDPVSP